MPKNTKILTISENKPEETKTVTKTNTKSLKKMGNWWNLKKKL